MNDGAVIRKCIFMLVSWFILFWPCVLAGLNNGCLILLSIFLIYTVSIFNSYLFYVSFFIFSASLSGISNTRFTRECNPASLWWYGRFVQLGLCVLLSCIFHLNLSIFLIVGKSSNLLYYLFLFLL